MPRKGRREIPGSLSCGAQNEKEMGENKKETPWDAQVMGATSLSIVDRAMLFLAPNEKPRPTVPESGGSVIGQLNVNGPTRV